jgi:hypothetical protein
MIKKFKEHIENESKKDFLLDLKPELDDYFLRLVEILEARVNIYLDYDDKIAGYFMLRILIGYDHCNENGVIEEVDRAVNRIEIAYPSLKIKRYPTGKMAEYIADMAFVDNKKYKLNLNRLIRLEIETQHPILLKNSTASDNVLVSPNILSIKQVVMSLFLLK